MELWLLQKRTTGPEYTDAATQVPLPDGPTLSLLGPFLDPNSASIPSYACISYIWGTRRTPNPLSNSPAISINTLPALQQAVRTSHLHTFWIDVFCVPYAQPARGATLESMGFIYARAQEVIVVLAAAQAPALRTVAEEWTLDEAMLRSLSHDEWINSVWTYQEVVNSKALRFVAAESDSEPEARVTLDGHDFFSRVGHSLELYKKVQAWASFDVRRELPGLDAFDELLGDWRWAGYTERSAMLVMSNLDRRRVDESRPQNRWYAMIGCVSSEPSMRSAGSALEDIAGKFLAICEERGDYSFIYAVSGSEEDDYRGSWRLSKAAPIRSMLQWHSWGEQRAREEEGGLTLEGMACIEVVEHLPAPAREECIYWLGQWSPAISKSHWERQSDHALGSAVYDALTAMGYTGSPSCVICTDGLFHVQSYPLASSIVQIVISTTLRWGFGAPGMAVMMVGDDFRFSPGVFVGWVTGMSASDFFLPG